MKKKNNKLLIGAIVLVAILGLVLWQTGALDNLINKTDDFIQVHYYDENGNPISVSGLSVVQGVLGVHYIDITVTATNTGTEPLTCSVVSATPTAFSTVLDSSAKFVPSANPKKASWTSDLIEVSQFEPLSQPVRFQATLRCSYTRGTETTYLSDKSGYVDLTITADTVNAGFDVGVNSGGTGTEFCGDGTCQVSESAISCPSDCAVAENVLFRTTDLSYVSGSAIARTATCGNTLTAYGYSKSGSSTLTTCTSYLDNLLVPTTIPCSKSSTCNLGSKNSVVTVCWIESGTVRYVEYTTSSPYASSVETTPTSFDSDKEVAC